MQTTIHELKTWPEYFRAVQDGSKRFEVRKNDRDFQQYDILLLREFDPKTETYTGRQLTREVAFILEGGEFGIEVGFVVMSLI